MNDIAHFAPDVLAAADQGDAVAQGIANEAAAELVLLARTAVEVARNGSPDATVVPVAVGGRLLGEARPLRRLLDTQLAAEAIGAAVRSADGSSLDGALALGALDDPGRYRSLIHVSRATAAAPASRGDA